MSDAAVRHWSADEFLRWQEGREGLYELVGGVPVKMMTGPSARHDNIVLNVLGELRVRLRSKPCKPFTADFCVQTLPGQIRRTDAGVDCDQVDPDALIAPEPPHPIVMAAAIHRRRIVDFLPDRTAPFHRVTRRYVMRKNSW
ncbi:Uma2 family endonuclease [Aurantimonas sp. VKM B-3413]|uniref:Uma2 family endonuclease n=1 Tax=Aurantimonas sp. VKM B-3413 TaxID=2779401 RepID=UPI001E3795A3|nr:Uma2 family endonuclease [Aurantimonas sp. VKM B-3413]MCB8838426.1 Uma2 family endonuclease [Aurantimonas sp. VKM B-3413]